MKYSENFPKSYNSHCQASTIKRIGQDMRGIIDYNFNKQGFRASVDYNFNEKNVMAHFGNLYASAVGIEWQNSYAQKACDQLNMTCYNFSQGCAGVDNNEIVRTVKHIVDMPNFEPEIYVIQFCELERRFSPTTQGLQLLIDEKQNIENFENVFEQLENIMQGKKWLFFGLDHTLEHEVPTYIIEHDNCLCWNPVVVDKILLGIAGEKWHAMMSYGLSKRIQNGLA